MSVSEDLLRYIEKSPTSYQAVEEAAALLSQEDFLELQESENWEICYGGSYFVRRNDSSLIAFSIPEEFQAAHICASHADSPLLKIKENPEIRKLGKYVLLNVEKYGGMLMNPWFDRPLSVAGRVVIPSRDGRNGGIG